MTAPRLGELLVSSGLISQSQLEYALREQDRTGVRLGQVLVDHNILDERLLYDALAAVSGLERLELGHVELDSSVLELVTAQWALENGTLPLRVDPVSGLLCVASTDPTNVVPIDALATRTGTAVRVFLAGERELLAIVRQSLHAGPRPPNPPRPRSSAAHADSAMSADSAVSADNTAFDESQIVRTVDDQREEARRVTSDLVRTGVPPKTSESDERVALAELKPIFDTLEDSARALSAIFELCITRGLIHREEYLRRLENTPD